MPNQGEREGRSEGRSQLTLKEVTRTAKEAALQKGGHAPTIIAQGSAGSLVGTLEQFPQTHKAKVGQMFSAGFLLGQTGKVGRLEQVFFISEGWLSQPEPGQLPERPPSQDPNRLEVLLVTHREVAPQRNTMACLEMVRNPEGQLTALRDIRQPEWNERSGRLESPLLDAFVEGFQAGMAGIN
jgi:hypothetical protein